MCGIQRYFDRPWPERDLQTDWKASCFHLLLPGEEGLGLTRYGSWTLGPATIDGNKTQFEDAAGRDEREMKKLSTSPVYGLAWMYSVPFTPCHDKHEREESGMGTEWRGTCHPGSPHFPPIFRFDRRHRQRPRFCLSLSTESSQLSRV